MSAIEKISKKKFHIAELERRRSLAAANARHALISWPVKSGKSSNISSSLMPPARYYKTSYTVFDYIEENVANRVPFDMEDNKGIYYIYGVEVSENTKESDLPYDFELKHLPSFDYAVFEHEGHVSEIR